MRTKPRSNGHWQLNKGRRKPFNFESYLAVDIESTGTDWNRPESDRFTSPALPFYVAACDGSNGNTWGFKYKNFDPYSRYVEWEPETIEQIIDLISQYDIVLFHNAPFDVPGLATIGVDLSDRYKDIHDTLPMFHCLDSYSTHGLKDLMVEHLDMLDTEQDILHERTIKARAEAKTLDIPTSDNVKYDYILPGFLNPEDDPVDAYGTKDVVGTALLARVGIAALEQEGLLHQYERERRVIEPTNRMMAQGVSLRAKAIGPEMTRHKLARDLSQKKARELSAKYTDKPINLNSPKQLNELLYEKWKLPVLGKTDKGNPSTNKDTLDLLCNALEIGIASTKSRRTKKQLTNRLLFIEAKQEFGLRKTPVNYLQNYLDHAVYGDDGSMTIYPRFNPWGQADVGNGETMATTRFSSSNPNAQNVGKSSAYPLRGVYGPPKGWDWYPIDYDQLEVRLMAKASQDPALLRVLNEGADRHQITCDEINAIRESQGLGPISRKIAKNINFAWQYGAGANKLSKMCGISADEFRDAMESAYPGVVAFMASTVAQVRARHRKRGFGYVETMFGYRLTVPIESAYKGTNYIIQGTAGDLMKNSMIAIHEYLRYNDIYDSIFPILTIHDELVFQVRKKGKGWAPGKHLRAIRDIMESAGDPIDCPTPVEVSKAITHWGNCKTVRRIAA